MSDYTYIEDTSLYDLVFSIKPEHFIVKDGTPILKLEIDKIIYTITVLNSYIALHESTKPVPIAVSYFNHLEVQKLNTKLGIQKPSMRFLTIFYKFYLAYGDKNVPFSI